MTDVQVTLELLESVRAEVQDDVDDIVVERLDEAIWMLKEAQRSQSVELDPRDILAVLGRVLEALPAIAQLLEFFSDCQ